MPLIPECERGLGAPFDLGQVADVVDVHQQLPEIAKQEREDEEHEDAG